MSLNIAPGLTLPDEMVTETVAILAKRGSGKSNTAVVMAEEMYAAGLQWVAIDPKGDWWGVRSDASGEGPGLSIPVFGGRHGDMPLDSRAGALMARLVIEQDVTCVLDVSDFDSKAEQNRFVTDFATTLFKLIRRTPRPLHLFLEEAEEFLPQQVKGGEAPMVGAYSKISKQGRAFGLGVTLVTQRSASLNKDALSQTDTLILHRTTSPHDRKAVTAWTEHQGEAPEVAKTLASLEPGEAWIVSPGFLGSTERVQIRRRRTFDSGATPKAGMIRRSAPVTLADIDVSAIEAEMAEVIEHAEAEDPKLLHRRTQALRSEVAVLTRERDAWQRRAQEAEAAPKVDPRLARALRGLHSLTLSVIDDVEVKLDSLREFEWDDLIEGIEAPAAPHRPEVVDTVTPEPRRSVPPKPVFATPGTADDPNFNLPKVCRAILSALASKPNVARPVRQVALMAGYSAKGGGFQNGMSRLRTMGLIERGDPVLITPDGLAAIEGHYEPLPVGRALLDHWAAQVKGSAGKILYYLADAYPETRSTAQIGEAVGMVHTAGGFSNSMSKLRTLGLIEGRGAAVRATDELMEDVLS